MTNEQWIRTILKQLGVGRSYQGYEYVVQGTLLVLEDDTRLEYVTKSLYPDIAKKYHTSWKCVERNIRTVVDVVWKDGNREFLVEICGGTGMEKPKNSNFLEILSEYVKKISLAVDGEMGIFKNGMEPGRRACWPRTDGSESGETGHEGKGTIWGEEKESEIVGNCFCPETGKWCEEVACLRQQIVRMKRDKTENI